MFTKSAHTACYALCILSVFADVKSDMSLNSVCAYLSDTGTARSGGAHFGVQPLASPSFKPGYNPVKMGTKTTPSAPAGLNRPTSIGGLSGLRLGFWCFFDLGDFWSPLLFDVGVSPRRAYFTFDHGGVIVTFSHRAVMSCFCDTADCYTAAVHPAMWGAYRVAYHCGMWYHTGADTDTTLRCVYRVVVNSGVWWKTPNCEITLLGDVMEKH